MMISAGRKIDTICVLYGISVLRNVNFKCLPPNPTANLLQAQIMALHVAWARCCYANIGECQNLKGLTCSYTTV